MKPPTFDRIQYGCGQNVLAGWLNVDGFKSYYPWHVVPELIQKSIFRAELAGPHPFPDESFRYAFAEDFLEHLDQAESFIFLCEAYRCLRKGGTLRLSFPGLEGVLRRHYRASDYQGAFTGYKEAYETWSHKHFFSLEGLSVVCRHIGYTQVSIVPFGTSIHPDLCGLDTRPDQMDLNLLVEITK